MTSLENNSERFTLDINLWQPWGDLLISPLIHALSSDHLDMAIFPDEIQKGYGTTTSTHKQLHPVQTVFAISKAHNGAHWGLPALASHVLWTEGRHISVISPSRPAFSFCLVSTKRRICLTLREPCMAGIAAVYNELCVCGSELAVNVTGGLLSVASGTERFNRRVGYRFTYCEDQETLRVTLNMAQAGRFTNHSSEDNATVWHNVLLMWRNCPYWFFCKCFQCILDSALNCAVF